MSDNTKKTGSRRKTDYPLTDYERIFHPRALAIIGVSAEENGVGFGAGMFRAITVMGFEGKIFPVNPKGGTIAGLEIYKRVEDIPGTSRLCHHRRDRPVCAGSPGGLPENRRGRRGDSFLRLQRTGNRRRKRTGKTNSGNSRKGHSRCRPQLFRHLLPGKRPHAASGAGSVARKRAGGLSRAKRRHVD